MDQPIRTYIHIVAWTTYAQSLALERNDPLVTMDGSTLTEISRVVIAHAENQNKLDNPQGERL
jgi:hypothetical protein